MWTSPPASYQLCDGLSRRNFLRIGCLAGGLTLTDLLRCEARSGGRASQKAVIMIFLAGGPPHQDMVDLKPDAPDDIRGEFKPIATNVAGIHLCELMPRLAQRMDTFAIVRSVVGCAGEHAAHQCTTGYSSSEVRQLAGGRPAFGAYVSKLQGAVARAVPPFVCLSPRMKFGAWAYAGEGGFLRRQHAPFTPNQGSADMVLRIPADQLQGRKALQQHLDTLRREHADNRAFAEMDQVTQRAYDLLTSSKIAVALELDREDNKLRDRYGRGSPAPAGYGDAAPLLNDYFLAARRLVEAGVRVVTLAYGRWDWHGKATGGDSRNNFENARIHLPMLDQGITALVDDLEQRGLSQDVSVLVWGEFGRTPKINPNGGRDHWPAVSCALLTGGGMRTGRVIGATDAHAAYAKDRPVHVRDILATLYHNLGIDLHQGVEDSFGRPLALLDGGHSPVKELI
jgi:hypothetical protein